MTTVLFVFNKNIERKHAALYQQSLDLICLYKMGRMRKTVCDFDGCLG